MVRGQALFSDIDAANLVMMLAPAPGSIINSFYDAVCHPHSQNRQSVPQTAHKQHMPGIPYPFKMKWKHYLPPLIVFRFKVIESNDFSDLFSLILPCRSYSLCYASHNPELISPDPVTKKIPESK